MSPFLLSDRLPRSFYLRPTVTVARELLGKYLVRRLRGHLLVGRIVETEAYRQNDPACHAYHGRSTRNDVMFRDGGHLYVYFTYGMHYCANVVTRGPGEGEAVLLRAIEPVEGLATLCRNRRVAPEAGPARTKGGVPLDLVSLNLTNGPARLCQAFKIGRKEDGTDLLGEEIFLLDAPKLRSSQIGVSTRVGITRAIEKRWRFFVKGNRWVSRTR